MNVKIDFDSIIGKIKPLHGVNNGPLTSAFTIDESEYFRDAGIKFSRLHDTEYPLGGNGRFVDIHCVFPDFDADESDPASYNFADTDRYIKAIYDCGSSVIYRLGSSIEHQFPKLFIFPPSDPAKWARICLGIIRHYNHGWANGFHYGIKYWEIWNEPENDPDTPKNPMWQGSDEQFFELYSVTAKAIKREFPEVMAGGYASCGFYALGKENPPAREQYFIDYLHRFLKYIKAVRAPLDFFSWHIYSPDVKMYVRDEGYISGVLRDYGFDDAETLLDEWNWSGADMFNVMKSMHGAAHVAAVFSALQKTPIALTCYYDGQMNTSYCGLFGGKGDPTPRKPLYSFKAWNELYKLGGEAQSLIEGESDGIYCAAACEGEKRAVLLVSYDRGESSALTLAFDGKYNLYTLDETHTLELTGTVNGGETLVLPPDTIILLKNY